MRIDHATIKDLAKEHRLRVADFLALDPSNDPFYIGRPAQVEQARWFLSLWERFGYTQGAHLRRIHYQLVSQENPVRADGLRYENTEGCWNYLCSASKYARILGYIEPTGLVDHRNPSPTMWGTVEPTPRPTVHLHGEPFETPWVELFVPELAFPTPLLDEVGDGAHDGFHLEVWVEKSTMNDVLEPLCREYRANLVTSLGFQSITSAVELLARIAHRGKPARIFYISDFDPAGDRMPTATSRQIEFWNGKLGLDLDIKVEHLALTAEQVRQHRLPRIPIKESDKRKGSFEARSGAAGAVELDALEALRPGELVALVRERLEKYRDPDHEAAIKRNLERNRAHIAEQWQATTGAEQAEFAAVRAEVDAVVTRYRAEVERLAVSLAQELAPLDSRLSHLWQATAERFADFSPTVYAVPEHPVPAEQWPWLLDTQRDYVQQILAYRGQTP